MEKVIKLVQYLNYAEKLNVNTGFLYDMQRYLLQNAAIVSHLVKNAF